MSESLNRIALILGEATLTLYPANTDGSPQLGSPVWSGVTAEEFRARERWLIVGTRPTGASTPRQRPLIPIYEIQIGRVWALPLDHLVGYSASASDYVLDVVWQDEEELQWHRRTFYGVTINARDLESRQIDGGFTDNQSFDARLLTVDGGAAPVPALSADLPYQVVWVGADGQMPLYSYNPATHLFTALAPVGERATVGYNGDAFEVVFADYPKALDTTATALRAPAMLEQMPLPTALPRLDFNYGTRRVASVTPNGLWARAFDDQATPAAGAGKFTLFHGITVVATLAATGAEALAFESPIPS